MVMKTAESKEKFDRNWELWCPAIINYVLATKNKSTALKCALRDMDMDLEGIIICIVCYTSAFMAICIFLCRRGSQSLPFVALDSFCVLRREEKLCIQIQMMFLPLCTKSRYGLYF